jgi:hypothetical protein
VEVGQAQTLTRQLIQCWGSDIPTEGTDIRITHVVGNDQQNIRLLGIWLRFSTTRDHQCKGGQQAE